MNTSLYYTSIVDLPLNKFIDCLVDNNVYALVKSGDPGKEELQSAWSGILMDYNDKLGDAESLMYAKLLKEITLLQITMKQIEVCIQVLNLMYDKQFADDLNSFLSTNFTFDITDEKQYYSDLKKAERRSKALIIQYQLKKSQFDTIEAKNKDKNSKPTREYFQKVLITLSDFAKYEINDSISTFQFCERVKRFEKYIKEVEKKK